MTLLGSTRLRTSIHRPLPIFSRASSSQFHQSEWRSVTVSRRNQKYLTPTMSRSQPPPSGR
jgi:hypothetical protein